MNSARRKKLCVDEAIIPAENFNHNIEKLPKFWRSFTKKGRKKSGFPQEPAVFLTFEILTKNAVQFTLENPKPLQMASTGTPFLHRSHLSGA